MEQARPAQQRHTRWGSRRPRRGDGVQRIGGAAFRVGQPLRTGWIWRFSSIYRVSMYLVGELLLLLLLLLSLLWRLCGKVVLRANSADP